MGVMDKDIQKVLYTNEQIKQRVNEIAAQLRIDYSEKDPVVVCVLNGAVVFYIDLMMALEIPLSMDFIRISSYGNSTSSSGSVRILYDLEVDIAGRDVLIVEDIIDSGRTLYMLTNLLKNRGANSVKCCCLLDKKDRREVPLKADYVGFDIPDEFVVGYGLDYSKMYRNLPYIGTLKPEIYEKDIEDTK